MGENCTGNCIMEGRIKTIEDNQSKQSEQYLKDKVESAVQITGMQKDIKSILDIQTGMNDKLTKVLEQRQLDEIEKAENKNQPAATKWANISTRTKNVIWFLFTTATAILIGYLFSRFGVKG